MRTTDRGSRDSAPASPVKHHASNVNCHIIARRSAGVRAAQYARSASSSSRKLRKTVPVALGRGCIVGILSARRLAGRFSSASRGLVGDRREASCARDETSFRGQRRLRPFGIANDGPRPARTVEAARGRRPGITGTAPTVRTWPCATTGRTEKARERRGRYGSSRFERVTQLGFVQRLQSLPTNIRPASVSPLKRHRSQFDATLANSPPPGWSTVAVWPALRRAP